MSFRISEAKMNRLLSTGILSIFLLVPFVASATGPEAGIFGDVSYGSKKPITFSDSFSLGTFPSSFGDVTLTVTDYPSPTSPSFGIKGLAFSLLDGSTPITGVETTITSPGLFTTYTFQDTFSSLPAGAYTIDVTGTFPTGGGEYHGGWLILPAVPEPSTWAAMLIGIGLMGYTVRGRRNRA
jgi:hypothetical protein